MLMHQRSPYRDPSSFRYAPLGVVIFAPIFGTYALQMSYNVDLTARRLLVARAAFGISIALSM
jgi:hypothetical protein